MNALRLKDLGYSSNEIQEIQILIDQNAADEIILKVFENLDCYRSSWEPKYLLKAIKDDDYMDLLLDVDERLRVCLLNRNLEITRYKQKVMLTVSFIFCLFFLVFIVVLILKQPPI